MCGMSRRDFLGRLSVGGLALTPLALALAACGKSEWPEGMAEIKWDRETCPRCSMVISDRRFAAQLRGGPKDMVVKFDDIGCALHYSREKAAEHAWLSDAATKFWVADSASKGNEVRWFDARKAHYVTATSPMAYNYAAVAQPQAGSFDFDTMKQHILAKER